jgi:transposase-like protein
VAAARYRGTSHPERRKVPRPPYDQLVEDVSALGFSATGRKYGVSDRAVRKWIRWYEAARDERPEEAPGERPKLEAVSDLPADDPEPPTVAA